jgi:hypothetical protein
MLSNMNMTMMVIAIAIVIVIILPNTSSFEWSTLISFLFCFVLSCHP